MYLESTLALAKSPDPTGSLNPFLMEGEYLERQRRRSVREGEMRLMLAILEDAIHCYVKYLAAKDTKGRQQFREAEEWIFERHSDWLFSFENICEILGIEPEYLRQGLLRCKKIVKPGGPEHRAEKFPRGAA